MPSSNRFGAAKINKQLWYKRNTAFKKYTPEKLAATRPISSITGGPNVTLSKNGLIRTMQANSKPKNRKPSMPKMPWENS